ncbi:MAG TPA: nuclear transport factor 2 family protein [Thermomonas sp.]|nr:nuclear transport factor 2 family protein [Thermomonas sp.]
MQQNRALQAIAHAAVLACALGVAACARPTAEEAVRAQVAALQDAIDARDAGAVQALLADDFVGNEGLDRRGARRLAAGVFLRFRDVRARIGPVQVEARGPDEAIARFTVLATGGSGGLLPEQGQLYRVDTGWRRVDGEWRLLSASWTPKL